MVDSEKEPTALKAYQEYRIIRDTSVSGLEIMVMDYLKTGWKAAGGVSVTIAHPGEGTRYWYVQAITRWLGF